MRTFSFRPTFSFKHRESHGLRGFEGKPFHPPLTSVPMGAYVLAAVFDVISRVGAEQTWAHDFYRAASFVLIGGAVVSVFAALTGYLDWSRTTEKGNQARRTVNAHAWTMIVVTLIVLTDITLRVFSYWSEPFTPTLLVILTVAAAALTGIGGAIGGTLVFDYGFNVATAGDSPVWHQSETDVLPGQKQPVEETPKSVRRVS